MAINLHRLKLRLVCLLKDHDWSVYRSEAAPVGWVLCCCRCGVRYPLPAVAEWLRKSLLDTPDVLHTKTL